MNRRLIIRIAVFAAAALGAASAEAATSTFQQGVNGYTGTADTYMRADQPTNRLGSATNVLVDGVSPIAHGLIRFDNIFGNGPGQITPEYSYINSARLIVRTINPGDSVWFHRILVPWDETNNWEELSSSGPGLQADDVEMSATPDFTFTPSIPTPRVDAFDVTATVRGWYSGTFPNYGWGITNSLGNGWQFDSSENPTWSNRPILEVNWDHGDPPPRIIRQPASSTNAEGSAVVLSVEVQGTDPSFQWFKDEVPINDATNSTYAILVVRRADAGSYTVVVSNLLGETSSTPAILTVIPDEMPPSTFCAYGTNDFVTVSIVFSEIVTNATERGNYAVFPMDDGENLTVARAMHPGGGIEGAVVLLTLDPATPFVVGKSYLLIAGGISDRFGNPIDPAAVTPIHLYTSRIFSINDSQIWRFNDSGNDLSNSWRDVDFDDTSWSSGPPLFGFETAPLPEPLRTQLNRTNGFGNSILTYYFRTHFSHSGATGGDVLRFRTVLDDAAAIYLNGVEIFRLRLPGGPLNYMTEGVGASVGDAAYEGPFTVCVSNLVNGDNVLAVEVHQIGFSSSDMVFGMEISALSPEPPPTCFGRQPTNQTVNAGNPVTFVVDYRCPYSAVQWFKDDIAIAGATNLTFTLRFVFPRDEGNYYAVIDGTQSATVQLEVLSCCAPEVIAVYATNETIVLQFNEEAVNGLDLVNFLVSAADSSHDLLLASAAYTSGTNYGTVLLLRIDLTTPMQPDTPYNIRLENIEDRFGNLISPQTWPIARFPASLIRLDASQQWRYETSGTDLSNSWYRLDYDDTMWPIGLALFDAKRPPRNEVSGQPVRTMTTLSNSTATAQIPAHYFRTRFNYAGPVSNVVCIRPFLDDGAVYYLNGRDIFRVGLPLAPASVAYNTLTSRSVTDANFEGPYYIAVTNLVAGQNLLAVEVHQQSIASSDLTFGTEFGLLLAAPLPRLRIALSTDGAEAILTWNGSAVLEQTSNLNPSDWAEVQGAVSGYRTPRAGMKFFRLRER